MGSIIKEVARELLPLVRVFNDGSVERLSGSPIIPASLEDLTTGVSSKDITISQDPPISARIHLPMSTKPNEKLPVLVYFHGGGFLFESAFSLTETTYMKSLVSAAKIVAISVEYRLAPEHPISIVYHDCWDALQWVASHSSVDGHKEEPWISYHGDFSRVFIGGDSAGANIVHNVLMRAGVEELKNDVKLSGAFLTHPYFWGSKPIGKEPIDETREMELAYKVWNFVNPNAPNGLDNHMINPVATGAPSLAQLECPRLLITVVDLDVLKDRGVLYYNAIKESGWKGEIELIEVEGEDHAFHIDNYGTESSLKLIKRVASFLVKC